MTSTPEDASRSRAVDRHHGAEGAQLTMVCKNCGMEIVFGEPHPDFKEEPPLACWFHVEHGGVTCGGLAPDSEAEPLRHEEA